MPYQCNFGTVMVTLLKIKMPYQAKNVIALNSSQKIAMIKNEIVNFKLN